MSTTALFSEILVTGILTFSWMLLVLMGVVGKDSVFNFLSQHQAVAGVLLVAYSYVVGVVFDRAWDGLTKPIDHAVRRKEGVEKEELRRRRKQLFGNQEKSPEIIEYIRGRMRIARAAFCNAVLITLAALFYYIKSSAQIELVSLAWIVGVGAFFIFFSFHALRDLLVNYYKQLYLLTAAEVPAKNPKEPAETVTIEEPVNG